MGEFSLDMLLEAAGDKARAIIRDQKRLLGQGPMPALGLGTRLISLFGIRAMISAWYEE
ncbi:MAG: hypothetical protein ACREVK_09505 [Gammaproteobacteria bacterium]